MKMSNDFSHCAFLQNIFTFQVKHNCEGVLHPGLLYVEIVRSIYTCVFRDIVHKSMGNDQHGAQTDNQTSKALLDLD